MVALESVSLAFSHDGRTLLDNVSLSVGDNGWVGLAGPSGGGKTLIGLIAAGVIPHMIHARLDGVVRLPEQVGGRRTRAAIVFQDPSFQLMARTVHEELMFTPKRLGWPEEEIARDVECIVDGLNLAPLMSKSPRELSMGEAQRVAVGVALIQRPQVIVMDEPTQYLDQYHVSRTLEFVHAWTRRHPASVLLIEHHLDLLKRFCDMTYTVRGGRAVPELPVAPVMPVNGLPVPPVSGPCSDLRHVTFGYKSGRPVLRDVNLSVSCGESVAILGPNGGGKSTLAKLMCGLNDPPEGTATLFGKKRSNGSWFRHIGYVMQNPDRQIFAPTVADECAFGPKNFGVESSVYEPEIEKRLREFGLTDIGGRDPLTLSYGEKRRMNIAGVAAYDPRVMIFDEPTSGLDVVSRMRLLERLKSWNADGKTLIVITHDLAFARATCRRAVFLKQGSIILDSPLNEIHDDDVKSLYGP